MVMKKIKKNNNEKNEEMKMTSMKMAKWNEEEMK